MCCSPTKSKFTLCSCCCCCCCSCCVKQNSCHIIYLAIVVVLCFLQFSVCTVPRAISCFTVLVHVLFGTIMQYFVFHLTTLGLCLNYAFYFHYYNLILYFKYKLIPIVQFYQFYAAFSFFSFTLKSKRQLEQRQTE